MSRRYDDPVEVRRRDDEPAEFLWRGRFYVVREVLARWVETGAWWQRPEAHRRRAGGLAGGGQPGPRPRRRGLRPVLRLDGGRLDPAARAGLRVTTMTTTTAAPSPATLQRRPPVVAAARDLLGTARHDLADAMVTTVPHRALRRGPPRGAARRRRGARGAHPAGRPPSRPRSVWVLLPQVAPELAEWAAFFAAGAGKRAAAEAGLSRAVTAARGRRPAPRRADLPRAGRDHPRAGPPAGPAAPRPTAAG